MKKYVYEFLRKGFSACGIGPVILAIVYLILQSQGVLETLTVSEVCTGIFSLSILSFLAGSMNAVYQIEKLPLLVAIFIHGLVLYCGYLITYLLNGWLDFGTTPILVFTAIFIVGYLVMWGVIYSIIKRKTQKLNAMLKRQQRCGLS